MNWLEHAVVLWLALLGPALDVPLLRKLKASQHPRRRLYAYWLTIGTLIGLTVLLWPSRGPTLLESPFGPPTLELQVGAWGLMALMAWNTASLWGFARRGDANRRYVHDAFAALAFVLPKNRIERRWFVPVALSAGIFEEILFRSFLVRYFDALPVWGAAVASAAIFGVAHFYQGWRGVLGTGVVALLFTVIVAGTGSLLVAMIVHALWDLRVLCFTVPDDHPLLNPAPGAEPGLSESETR